MNKPASTIALVVPIMAALAFVGAIGMIGNFASKVFAQGVFPPSPVPGPNPSPNEQAIIHACANIAHSQGRPPFCTGLSTPPPPSTTTTTTTIQPGEGIASPQTISPTSPSLTLPPSSSVSPIPNDQATTHACTTISNSVELPQPPLPSFCPPAVVPQR
jgi:hypothetical protein